MKKILCAAMLISLASPSFTFAGTITTGSVSNPGVAITGQRGTLPVQPLGQLSNNVSLGIAYSANTYAATTKHLNGTKMYGSSAGDTKIFFQDSTTGTLVTAPGNSDSSAFSSGWSSL